ncbi:MAG: hypothetical protein K8F91_05955 [Candidatus Obscuribacterales bacterium]|nr:hypothetical protein [Candidatus Obscuribacterales bacterium]
MFGNYLTLKKNPEAEPVSKDQIDTLKLKTISVDRKKAPLGYKVSNLGRELLHYLTYRAGSMKTQCPMYGHVPPHAPRPAGEQQHCGECGVFIRHPRELRKAVARYQ